MTRERYVALQAWLGNVPRGASRDGPFAQDREALRRVSGQCLWVQACLWTTIIAYHGLYAFDFFVETSRCRRETRALMGRGRLAWRGTCA